ncbi:MAG: KEOPS complex subunit Cgi121 [Halobacteriales archaeon]
MRVLERTAVVEETDDFLARLAEVRDEHAVVVQAFDARYVVSRLHVEEAVGKARRSFDRGENVADTLSMEVLLYAAGTRQIDVATRMGLRPGEHDAVFVVDGDAAAEKEAAERVQEMTYEPDVFTYGDETRLLDFFGLTDEEVDAVGKERLEALVLERVALLDVNK